MLTNPILDLLHDLGLHGMAEGYKTREANPEAMARAIAADVPFTWVAADSVYGVGEIETALRRAGKGYVLGVNANHVFRSWHPDVRLAGEAKDIADALPTDAWVRLSAGHGTKGERLYDWVYRPLADLDATEYGAPTPGLWTRGMLIRRTIADGERAYFTIWAPQGTSIEALVQCSATIRMRTARLTTDGDRFRASLPNRAVSASWKSPVEAPRRYSTGK